MPSPQEIAYHRTFLALHICRTIYNEDERYQHSPSGNPGRQRKIEADPVFAYHANSCPKYPAPSPYSDRRYSATMAINEGQFTVLEIIPKRGQQFVSVATDWERRNSVLCAGAGFNPVVNTMMEVTGHTGLVDEGKLIRPTGVVFATVEEYIANDVPLYLWNYQIFDAATSRMVDSQLAVPPGWESFANHAYVRGATVRTKPYNGGITVMILPNGKVIGATGHEFQANNGVAISVMSPLDFWAPGSGLLAGAIRRLTNRVGGVLKAGFELLAVPTREMADAAALRLGANLATRSGSTTAAAISVKHFGRRTLIMGEDMAKFESALARSHSESGFYDVMIHGETNSFAILESSTPEVWREVSAREVAEIVRPQLQPGDKIRLLTCKAGLKGPQRVSSGPAQRLANELGRELWASEETLSAVPKTFPDGHTVFVPEYNGKFRQFLPQPRGDGTLVGPGGGKVSENVMHGDIPKAK